MTCQAAPVRSSLAFAWVGSWTCAEAGETVLYPFLLSAMLATIDTNCVSSMDSASSGDCVSTIKELTSNENTDKLKTELLLLKTTLDSTSFFLFFSCCYLDLSFHVT